MHFAGYPLSALLGVFAVAGALAVVLYILKLRRRPVPVVVSRAAMPFFVVHQPVIVAVAFVVVRWQASIGVKLVAVLTASFAISVALAWALSRIPIVSLGVGVKRTAPAAS